MRKSINYNELKDIKTTSYRRIIIFSNNEMYIFKKNSFHTYIRFEKMEFIMNEYIKCVKNTGEINLPYLFIFNNVEILDNVKFFDSSNWIIIKK